MSSITLGSIYKDTYLKVWLIKALFLGSDDDMVQTDNNRYSGYSGEADTRWVPMDQLGN